MGVQVSKEHPPRHRGPSSRAIETARSRADHPPVPIGRIEQHGRASLGAPPAIPTTGAAAAPGSPRVRRSSPRTRSTHSPRAARNARKLAGRTHPHAPSPARTPERPDDPRTGSPTSHPHRLRLPLHQQPHRTLPPRSRRPLPTPTQPKLTHGYCRRPCFSNPGWMTRPPCQRPDVSGRSRRGSTARWADARSTV